MQEKYIQFNKINLAILEIFYRICFLIQDISYALSKQLPMALKTMKHSTVIIGKVYRMI